MTILGTERPKVGHPVAMGTTGERWTLGHRPALDGIRGIAILLVLASHAVVPHSEAAGAVGVTLFFVLSGFLITALLLEERQQTGRTNLARFYVRRARRLLPALLVSVALVVAVAPMLGPWWFEWSELPAVLLYFGNWMQASPGVSLGALAGTWSLAVEEQFYLLWPLVIACVGRRGPRVVLWVATLGATGSLLLRMTYIQQAAPPERIYYGTDMLTLPLLTGAALAAWRLSARPSRSRPWLVPLGVLVLLIPTGWAGTAGPVYAPVVATLGASLVIVGVTARDNVPALQGRVIRWFGQRSYGIYLCHVPLSMLLKVHLNWGWPALVLAIIPASLLLAEVSYRWVEMPFRATRRRRLPIRQGSSVIAATVVHEPS